MLAGSRRAISSVPIKIRPPMAARLTDELGLKIRPPDIIRPAIPADLYRMGAFVVAAANQQAANARGPHFPESDLLFASHGACLNCYVAFGTQY